MHCLPPYSAKAREQLGFLVLLILIGCWPQQPALFFGWMSNVCQISGAENHAWGRGVFSYGWNYCTILISTVDYSERKYIFSSALLRFVLGKRFLPFFGSCLLFCWSFLVVWFVVAVVLSPLLSSGMNKLKQSYM